MASRQVPKPTCQFTAKDALGRVHTINGFVEVLQKKSKDGRRIAQGVTYFTTLLGDRVVHLGSGKYRIMGLTQIDLSCDDHSAP